MNYKNRISVLISNYNKGVFLEQTLKMLEKQNYKNFEVILFDDASKDKSLEIIKKFKNIKILINKKKSLNFRLLIK